VKTGAYGTCCKQFQFQFQFQLSPMNRYLGRFISISGFDNFSFLNILTVDAIHVSTFLIMSKSKTQPSTSMASSRGDDDTISDVLMADP
jgi:hypothetical protein